MGIEGLNILSTNSPCDLAKHLLPYHHLLSRTFFVDPDFLEGKQCMPYYVDSNPKYWPTLIEDISLKSISQFQPSLSLLQYISEFNSGQQTLLYAMTEYKLNLQKSFTTFCPVGLYDSSHSHIKQYITDFKSNSLRHFTIKLHPKEFRRLTKGDFLPAAENRPFPGSTT